MRAASNQERLMMTHIQYSFVSISFTRSNMCETEAPVKIGNFSSLDHGLSGEVFMIHENTLLIKHFFYDGLAPAATFLAGKSGEPGRDNSIIIPHPFDGKSYNYEDDAPILAKFNNEEIA